MKTISKQWGELAMRFTSPLLQYEWFAACAETLLRSDQLRIVVNHSHEAITAVAPLVLTRHGGPERLEILGARVLDEPTGFIYESKESLEQLTAAILGIGKPLLLGRLRNDSPEINVLDRQHTGKYFLRADAGSPFIEFRTTWDDLVAGMSSDNRHQLRRKQKLLEQQGTVSFEIFSPEFDKIEHDLEEIIRVEATGWKGKQRTAMAFDWQLRCFYETYAREAGRQGLLRLSFLRIDGKAIAAQVGVLHANRFWLLKVAYDEEWAKCSPGVLLTNETIRYACQQGLEGFEFLGHDEQWIHRWTRHTHPCVTFRSYPFSFGGVGTFAFDACNSMFSRSPIQKGRQGIRKSIVKVASMVTQQIAPKYIAGLEVEDAIRICRQIDGYGWRSAICPWDGPNDTLDLVASGYRKALHAIRKANLDCYLSIKPPALRYDFDLLKELLELASEHNSRVHFDSLSPDTASPSFALLERAKHIYKNLGCTLPSRWRRSSADAERAVDLEVAVRVVKGQWPDPAQPAIDSRAHYLDLIDVLAGRVPKVAVASHDVVLATDSLLRLKKSGTPCEMEQLFGLPLRIGDVAEPLGITVRVYVPYGYAYLPYALSEIKKRPVILSWILRDLFYQDNSLRTLGKSA
ncbi:MAG: GNAT family N-acetyltransferase [Terriglobales bacterium]